MIGLFQKLFEWFGLIPFYSVDMGDYLLGFDVTCTGYIGNPWYTQMGLALFGSVILAYILHYHVIDSPKYNKLGHWWITAIALFIVNFAVGFVPLYNEVVLAEYYCEELYLGVEDCLGFALSMSIWSLLLFVLLTSFPYPRRFSTNASYTTFWKP